MAFIGLGSNLNDPINQVKKALHQLKSHSNILLIQASSLYSSSPQGDIEQPNFINAVAKIATNLEPYTLLKELQGMEKVRLVT